MSNTTKKTKDEGQKRARGPFALLDASSGAPRFRKEILAEGDRFSRLDGVEIVTDRGLLEKLAANTNRRIRAGQKVWFPEGTFKGGEEVTPHNAIASANLGDWSPDFEVVEEDGLASLYGVVKVEDEAVAPKIGKGIKDVSPAIQWDAEDANGETFDVVLEHVAATPNPVATGKGNFVAVLAKEVPVSKDKKAHLAGGAAADDAGAEGEGEGSSMSAKRALEHVAVLVGADADSDPEDVVAAVRACLMDEDEEDAGGESVSGVGIPAAVLAKRTELRSKLAAKLAKKADDKHSAELAKVNAKVAELVKKDEDREAALAEGEIEATRELCASARGAALLSKETEALARKHFKAGDKETARALLSMASRTVAVGGTPAPRAELAKDKAKEEQKTAAVGELLAIVGQKPAKK